MEGIGGASETRPGQRSEVLQEHGKKETSASTMDTAVGDASGPSQGRLLVPLLAAAPHGSSLLAPPACGCHL